MGIFVQIFLLFYLIICFSALMLGALCELHNETECAIMQRLFHMGNVNAKAVKVTFRE
jgi:hypothetical protein